jgi:hypothetical protein
MIQQKRVIIKRLISPDGKVIAEARSLVITSDDNGSHIQQSVTVDVSANSSFSRSQSSASVSNNYSVSQLSTVHEEPHP